jgi:hypothetical protein
MRTLPHGASRPGLVVARIAVAVGAARVFLLQVRTVQQQHFGQVARGRGRVHRAAKAALHQHRQPAAVVEVGMAEHDRVAVQQLGRGRRPVALAVHLVALEQPAIQQDALAAQLHQVARAGDGVGRAVEADLHV